VKVPRCPATVKPDTPLILFSRGKENYNKEVRVYFFQSRGL